MASERTPHSERPGKLLLFRRLRSNLPGAASDARTLDAERAARLLRARLALLLTRSWIVAAWLLAALRVHRAVVSREVFGAEASLAFLVAVVVPLARTRAVVSVVGEVAHALRRRRARTDGPTGPKSHAA